MSVPISLTKNRSPNTFDSVQFRITTPDGTMFMHVIEDAPGKIQQIQVNIGKAGLSVAAWSYAVAELVNQLLAKGTSLSEIIVILSGITSGKTAYIGQGVECRSGPEGIAIALMQYRNGIPADAPSSGRRGPRFLNRPGFNLNG